MAREIKSPPAVILRAESFDKKHAIEFNENSHRYKMDKRAAVGVTTYIKAGYVTSMGLISWMKSQTAEALFSNLTVPGEGGFVPREGIWPLDESEKELLIGDAKKADRAVSQEAADIGTICHGFAELNSLGRRKEADALLAQVQGAASWSLIESCVRKYLEWDATNVSELVVAEGLVGYPCGRDHEDEATECLCFCGKFDRLDRVKGKLILRDYKTSKDIFLENYIQLGAYSLAIEAWLGLKVEGLEILRFGKDDGTFENLLVDDPKEIKIFQAQAIRCRETHAFRKMENDPRWKWEAK